MRASERRDAGDRQAATTTHLERLADLAVGTTFQGTGGVGQREEGEEEAFETDAIVTALSA